MRKFFFILFVLPFFFFLLPKKISATTLFSDNFDDGEISDWTVIHNAMYDNPSQPCYNGGSPTTWTAENGKIGIRINGPSCVTEIVPNGFNLDGISNFSISFDMEFRGSIYDDRHVLIKYKEPTSWYNFKIYGTKIVFQKLIGGYYRLDQDRSYSFEDNGIYRFKINYLDNVISLFINNQLIWEVLDNNPPYFEGGFVGFQASVGANPDTEVWFDNVRVCSADDPCGDVTPTETPTPTPTPTSTPTPTPTPAPPIPIVFIPGIGGSINFKEMFLDVSDPSVWEMTPGTKVYDNLLKAFAGNPNFHIFYYDWRKSVLESSQKLNDYIKNTVHPPNNKVDLIGHSLGGLVGRTCVQQTDHNCYVDKLITVGSPHLGVVDAYPAVEAGEIWRKGPMKLGFEVLLHYFQKPGETRKETLTRIAPVIYELLPNFDYLKKAGLPIPWESVSVQNPLLPQLSDLSPLENLTATICGKSFSTLRFLNVVDRNWIDKLLGNWADGKPISKEFDDGDVTVLSISSIIDNPQIEKISLNLDHGGIISNQSALEEIFQILGLELPADSYNSLIDDENYLVFFVHSPLKISLSDLPPAAYATDEIIIIPNPENKNYSLNLIGLENDYYSLSVGQIFKDSVHWNDYFGEAKKGIGQTFVFSINPNNINENPLIDPQGNTYIIILKLRVNEFQKEIQDLKIREGQKKVLLNFLKNILKDFAKSDKSFSHLSSLRKVIAAYENEHILNSETATIFRNKASEIAESLEFLAFINPKQTKRPEAERLLKTATKIKESVKTNKITKEGALVFLEADEKLSKAQTNFTQGQYYKTKIYSQEAQDLFLEAGMIK